MADLFEAAGLGDDVPRPLADRLRPQALKDIAGQTHLLGQDGLLTRMVAQGRLRTLFFGDRQGRGKRHLLKLWRKKPIWSLNNSRRFFLG